MAEGSEGPPSDPSPPSHAPGGSFSVVPRVGDPTSQRPPTPQRPPTTQRPPTPQQSPGLPTPASLLPRPVHQSSNPPVRRSAPAPLTAGRLLDDFAQSPGQLSVEVAALLRGAEERVKEEFALATVSDAPGRDDVVVLTRELLAVLERPVGDYGLESLPLASRALEPSEAPEGLREELSDPKTTAVALSPPPPTAVPHSAPEDTEGGSRSEPLAEAPPVDRTAKTRPPRLSAATQRAGTEVPRPPPLPKNLWADTGLSAAEREVVQFEGRDSLEPRTSPSALTDPGADRGRAASSRPGGTAPPARSEDGASTIPPSTVGSSTQAPERSRSGEEEFDAGPTTRPPGRRDTAPPEPPGPVERPATAAVAEAEAADAEGEIVELREGTAVATLATAIRKRFTGAVAFESDQGIRRVVLRDGDLVTVASGIARESLVHFLIASGTLPAEASGQLGHRVPSFGRHAGAALIASGHLPQDQLWPTLRAHAEFILGRALSQQRGVAAVEATIPERLRAEPSVFGGATGSEVLVELCRRVISPETALRRLGGPRTRFVPGSHHRLLEECALHDAERSDLSRLASTELGEVLADAPGDVFVCALYALRELCVFEAVHGAEPRAREADAHSVEMLDDEAIRRRVRARRALVDEADYFTLLGVPRSATAYHIRKAFLDLRRSFEPGVVLRPGTLDLRDDVTLIGEVLEEAYEVLRDPAKRERYRRALEAVPPGTG